MPSRTFMGSGMYWDQGGVCTLLGKGHWAYRRLLQDGPEGPGLQSLSSNFLVPSSTDSS